MLIKFKNAVSDGKFNNPVRWGDGDDLHVAVCSPYALKLYHQTFADDPLLRYHNLTDDVMDTGDDGGAAFTSLVGIDWEVDMKAAWAMIRSADVAGLNDGVGPVPDIDRLIDEHAGDLIDFSDLHACVVNEIDATFRTLTARIADVGREQQEG